MASQSDLRWAENAVPEEARPPAAQVKEEWQGEGSESTDTVPLLDKTNIGKHEASHVVTNPTMMDGPGSIKMPRSVAAAETADLTMAQAYMSRSGSTTTSHASAGSISAMSPISPSQSRSQPPSAQTSSSSLQSLEHQTSPQSLLGQGRFQRSGSIRSGSRNPLPSHQKSSSTSNPRTRPEHPIYPDQSFAALQYIGGRPSPVVRARSSNSYQNTLDAGRSASPTALTVHTMGNTPITTPGLFSLSASRPSSSTPTDAPRGLHDLHDLATPKETTKAEVDRDMFTGLKTINYYEVLREIGRGRQGKVKFARNLLYDNPDGSDVYCAIKIVPRASGVRRLGRIAEPTTDVKREIAILKLARHPNVVALYEVIDDPEYRKVYLILEYVQRGEILWRTHAPDSIVRISNRRWELELAGKVLTIQVEEQDLHKVQIELKHRVDIDRRFDHGMTMQTPKGDHFYSHSEADEESSELPRSLSSRMIHSAGALSRSNSRDDYTKQPDEALAGSYYGSYKDISSDLPQDRRGSLAFSAVSHMSSDHDGLEFDEQEAYVPVLTFNEARRCFQNVLLGLEYLHHIGIIHRDIKPANLLVSRLGEVKISDFGVSYLGKPLTEEEADVQVNKEEAGEGEAVVGDKELSKSVGTPAFWAPELCYDDTSIFADNAPPKISGALDLWSLGVTLYCMVYARIPFYAEGELGLHEAICTAEPFYPATRLVPVQDNSLTADGTTNSNKRSEYELKFEYVPEAVRDLIRKLLVKDPSKRMTVKQAKLHPWVIEGLQDPTTFLERTSLPEEGKDKLAKEAEKEIDTAIRTISAFQNIVLNAKSVVGSLVDRVIGGRISRGTSVATSASGSSDSIAAPSSSSGSTVGRQERSRESRRRSLKLDEMATVLKASRENAGEHPLAQSQTASPDQESAASYFPDPTVIGTASTSAGAPITQPTTRPSMSERAISCMSTTDSVKTIRAPQPSQRASILDHQDFVKATLNGVSSTISDLWEGAPRRLSGKGDRTSSDTRDSRSPSLNWEVPEGDVHSQASVAVSTVNASGDLATPERLRRQSPSIDTKSPTPFGRTTGAGGDSVMVPTSSTAAFQEAHEINQRKQIHEIAQQDPEGRFKMPENQIEDECPPSPDDLSFHKAMSMSQRRSTSSTEPQEHITPIQTLPSASTIASSTDGVYNYSSNASQGISNPSLGIGSGTSSPPWEPYSSTDKEAYHPARQIRPHAKPAVTGKPVEQQADHEHADDDHSEEDDDEDSSDDDGIMMGSGIGRKSATS